MSERARRRGAEQVAALAAIEDKLRLLIQSEGWSEQRRRSWLDERLGETLRGARETEFWRRRISPALELASVRPLDRSTLRAGQAAMQPADAGPRIRRRTSGSTGRPVEVFHGPAQIGYAAAARWRQLAWFGLPARELPTANIWAAMSADEPVLVSDGTDPALIRINPWKLNERSLSAVHERILAVGGVRLVGGTTSMLEQWADLYRDSDFDASELGIELAIVGGEMTYEEQRRRIEEAFGCRSANMYGSWEAQMIACECPQGHLHINEEVVHVEILGEDGCAAKPGDFGRVAVTLLHNPEFPLVRYLVGDVARWAQTPRDCGRPQPTLDLGIARQEDMISCRDGRRIHPRVIRSAFERELGGRLRAFHTVQEDYGRFRARLEVDGGVPGSLAELVKRDLRACMDEDVTLDLAPSDGDSIERLRSGKMRTFTNRVAEAGGGG